jgi:hypothetical protein
LPAADVEIGGGDVERMTFVMAQDVVQDIGHCMSLVVDDEWDGQDLAPCFCLCGFSLMQWLWNVKCCTFVSDVLDVPDVIKK